MSHVTTYFLDGEPQSTNEKQLTAAQILEKAGLDLNGYYLVEIHGHNKTSYENKSDVVIKIHENQKFISVFIGETPVS